MGNALIIKWTGKEFDLKDGDHVRVTGAYMAPSHRDLGSTVCLVLQSRRGELFLTTRELEMNRA